MSDLYSPPEANLIDKNGAAIQEFKFTSVWLLLLYAILTLGIYMPFWFFSINNKLKNINKVSAIDQIYPVILLLLYVVSTVVAFLPIFDIALDRDIESFMNLIDIGANILLIVMSFMVKNRLEKVINLSFDHSPMAKLSPVLTFLFSIFYLQSQINKYLALGDSIEA